ncbi:MAG: transglycosylase SLT domain-containing protein [Bacteroidales bacterium]|nr:transglycosylase SLT domain-containing protein [Bacteroidales bacterium]
MRFKHISLAALAAFTLIFTCASEAPAQTAARKTNPKSKKELLRENARMRSVLDSLLQEIEALKDTAYEEVSEPAQSGYPALGKVSPEDYRGNLTDSLLSIWYLQRRASELNVEYNMDSVKFASDVPDKVFLQRLADLNSYITLPFNETVRNYIILYAEKRKAQMASMLALADYYLPIFEATFNKYGMPEELKYMAVIESAFNPVAVSRAGARGMWQFMYTTAKNYGLTVNSFVDERLDPVKSADAAARYLYDAYKIFGDWNLAISSYNCGAGNVNKAIKRSGSRDFWAVYDFLPRETRGYVPAFVGAMYAFRYYREHGITPDPVRMPAHVDTFHIRKMLHFQQVSELTGVSVDMLRNLNPQYVHDIIPGNEREYVLRLPYQYSGKFIENEDSVYAYKAKELFSPATLQNIAASGSGSVPAGQRITYKVKSGDYLGRIASKYHVTVAQLKEWNHLRSNNLRIGQVLVIYGKGAAPAAKASSGTAVAKPASAPSKPDPSVSPTGEYVTYVVKEGDSLFRISKNYPGVSADDIMKFNGIGPDIRPGMTIKIPKVK